MIFEQFQQKIVPVLSAGDTDFLEFLHWELLISQTGGSDVMKQGELHAMLAANAKNSETSAFEKIN